MDEVSQKKKIALGSPWDYIRLDQSDRPWGAVLDAGTGEQSLAWLVDQTSACWTAVSACPDRIRGLRQRFGPKIRKEDRLVMGTWSDTHLLSGEVYDTVIAQYLLGAVERFAPYQEHRLFQRLRTLVGGRLYVIGLQPITTPSNREELLVSRLLNYRDAAFLHCGSRHYREYPLSWVLQNLERSGYEILGTRCFQNCLGEEFVNRIIDSTQARAVFWDPEFAEAYREHGERLRDEILDALEAGPLNSGFDYLVTAQLANKVPISQQQTCTTWRIDFVN